MATIQGIYLALFGRPADPTGLAYFNGVTKNGADLSGIGNLAGQKEYTDRFTGKSTNEIINSIYQSLFGRDGESAGVAFWANKLATGALTVNNIAIAILDGALGSDKTIVTAKIAAADLFTAHLDLPVEQNAYGASAANITLARDYITTVGSSHEGTGTEVDAVIARMLTNAGQAPGDGGDTSTGGGGGGSDTTAPDAPTLAITTDHKANTAAISGDAENGSTVHLYLVGKDGVLTDTGITTTAVGGHFSIEKYPIPANIDGTFNVVATATDASGNVSIASEAVTVSYDNVAPGAPSDISYDAATKTISGTAEAGSHVALSNGATVLAGDITVNGAGHWSYTAPDNNGTALSFSATATDAAGNTGAAGSQSLTYDNVAPGAPSDISYDPATKTISGTAEAGSHVALSNGATVLAGDITVNGAGHWSYTAPDNNGTALSFSATATDAAGNTGAAGSQSLTYDNVAPGAPSDISYDPATKTISGTAEAGSHVALSNGATVLAGDITVNGAGHWSYTAPDNNGTALSFSATATDAAGNTGAAGSQSLTYDNVAPGAPSDISYDPATKTISGTAEAGSHVALSNGATVLAGDITVNGAGHWSYTAPDNNGTALSFSATATDAAGNTGAAGSQSLTYDNVAPGAPSDISYDPATKTISGTAEAGSHVALSNGATVLAGDITVNGAGHWSYTAPDNNGTALSFSATATDAAGNTGAAGSQSLTYDNVAPGAPSDISYDPATKTISGTAEAGSHVALSNGATVLAGDITVNGAGHWSYTAPDNNGTALSFSATATDAAGNTGAAGSQSLTYDNVAPGAPSDISYDPATKTISGTAEAGSHVALSNGATVLAGDITVNGAGHWSYTAPDNNGTALSFSATATDAAGNTGAAGSQSLTYDNVAPTFTSVAVASVAENVGSNVTVYTATSNDAAATYSLSAPSDVFSISSAGVLTFKAGVSPDYETQNSYTVGVVAHDVAGNASATKTVTINVTDVAETTTATGTDGPDTIDKTGSVNNWTINGGAGADVLKGGSGNDTIDGGDTPILSAGTKESFFFTLDSTGNKDGSILFDFDGSNLDTTISYKGTQTEAQIAANIKTELEAKGFAVSYSTHTLGGSDHQDITVTYGTSGNKGTVLISEPVNGKALIGDLSVTNGTDPSVTGYNTAADRLTGGAGADKFVITASTVTAMDTITDFKVSENDKFDFNLSGVHYEGAKSVSVGSSLADAVNTVLDKLDYGNAGTFTLAGETYLVLDGNPNSDTFTTGLDQVVKITGLVGTLTDANFV